MPWHGADWRRPELNTISLLPPELKIQQHARRRKAILLLAGAAMLVIFILINLIVTLTLRGVEKENALVEQQRSQVQMEINKLQEYVEIQEQVNTVESILDAALGTEPEWHNLLLTLTLNFPTGLQLTTISAYYEADTGELYLTGRAPTHDLVEAWVEQLEKNPLLGEIDFRINLVKGPSGITGVDFQITAALQPGEPAGGRKEMLIP